MSLAADDVVVRFGERTVLDGCSLRLSDGEIVALQGPSGVGKSTLLRAIAGLIVPARGRIEVDGVDVSKLATHRRNIGLVFQDNQLFDHIDVAGNVGFGLRVQRRHRHDRRRRIADMLTLVGMDGFEARDVSTLSGGEAKRVAVARALAPAPRVLLLDEPLTGLDDELRRRLAAELAVVLRTAGTTTLLVTHDDEDASILADRTIRLVDLTPAPTGSDS
jgi:thiamine transport system ATP-binding protein